MILNIIQKKHSPSHLNFKIMFLLIYNLVLPKTEALPTNKHWKDLSLWSLPEPRYRRNSNLPPTFNSNRIGRIDAGQKFNQRRGVDIEVKVATKYPSLKNDLLNELERELRNISYVDEVEGNTPCTGCEQQEIAKEKPRSLNMKPAYHCDVWDAKSRTCWLDRNIGDTVTFVLAFGYGYNPHVQWRQEFHTLFSRRKSYYVIDSENPLWNIVIGSKGHELRLSPITEIDIDDNFFSAHVVDEKESVIPTQHKINFRIRVMPIDQGFVYPGETLIMNMKRVSLPPMSMTFKWYLETRGESGTLPSNMRLSPTGGVLTISELRKEQEGILACSVYTNLGYFATKQRFLIKEMNQTNNMLLFVPTRPSYFSEEFSKRKRRDIESPDYIDQALEEKQQMNEKLKDVADIDSNNNEEVEDNNKSDDSYDITKISVYRNNLEDNSHSQGKETNEDELSFRKELEDRRQPKKNSNSHHSQKGQHHLKNSNLSPNSQMQSSRSHLRNGHRETNGNFINQNVPQYDYPKSTNDNASIVLEIERKPIKVKMRAQDELSKMISTCQTNSQCSTDAVCVLGDTKPTHFCRCIPGYQGNGIFCWEDIKLRNSGGFSEYLTDQEQIFTEFQSQNPESENENSY